jgi:hypothetical protein
VFGEGAVFLGAEGWRTYVMAFCGNLQM